MTVKNILISQQPPKAASPYSLITEKYGVHFDFVPFFTIEPLSSREFRTQRINILDHTAIVFSARSTIDAFFHLCEELRVKIPETMKYFCTTEAVAMYLQKHIIYRKRKIFYGDGTASSVISLIGNKHKDETFLIATSDLAGNDEVIASCIGHTHIDVAWWWTVAQTREKDGIYRCASRVRVLVALVVHGSVHQASPIYESCPYKQPCTFLLRCIVYSQRCIRICGISGLVCLFRHAVLMQVVSSESGACSDAAVDYRQFPPVSVVYLGYARNDHGTGEHGSYPQVRLVGKPSEKLLECEHLVRCVGRGGSVRIVVVSLRESLFPELCVRCSREE